MSRPLLAIAFAVLLASCSPAPPPPAALEQILQDGELRVVTRYSPTSFYTHDEEGRGVDYELVRGFADRLGVELRIQVADELREVISSVADGGAHIGAANLTVTASRSERVRFGPGYQKVEQDLVYHRARPRPRGIADLIGGRIMVVAGSSHVGLLERSRREHPQLEWVEDPSVNDQDLVRMVADGTIDYTVIDSHGFRLLRDGYPEVRAAFSIGQTGEMAWALPKAAGGLAERVTGYFAEIEATGELQEVLDRYYVSSREFHYVESRAFARHLRSRLTRYRPFFEEAELETDLSWRLLAAMAYQESHWNPRAVSPTGVRGLMMLTKHTAELVGVDNRNDPRESILGGARYLTRVQNKIPARIAEPDRLWLSVAAYNLGFGHLEDARVITEIQGGDPDNWQDVRARLPLLEDERWYKRVKHGYAPGSQAVTYVDNIQHYHEKLEWMTADDILPGNQPVTAAQQRSP